jgi:5-methyltetrahydropteroyltriglutamate--homocysteine methyltransferase
MPVYKRLLEEIAKLDESVYVQFDEPAFVLEYAASKTIIAGVVDGRNIWHSDLSVSIEENKGNLLYAFNSGSLQNSAAENTAASSGKKARDGTYSERNALQRDRLNLPLLSTTTIGSFPQTPELRKARNDYRKGVISSVRYEIEMKKYIDNCIAFQEEVGLDVLVHGEPERNDKEEKEPSAPLRLIRAEGV